MCAVELDLYDFLMQHRNMFIGIDGRKRVGKTMTMSFMQMLLYKFNHKYEESRLKEDAEALHNMGFKDVEPLPYAIFSNYKNYIYIPTEKELKRQRIAFKIKSWFFNYNKKIKAINADKSLTSDEKELLLDKYKLKPLEAKKPFETHLNLLRVPNEEKEFQHFPYGSWIFISEELSKELNNVDSDVEFDSHQFEFFQQQGHNGITLIAETQLLSRSAAWAREFIDVQLYLAKSMEYEDHLEILAFLYEGEQIVKKFGFNHRFPIDEARKKKLQKSGELDGEDNIKLVKINVPFYVKGYYNHQEHREKFLRKLTKYSAKQWQDGEESNTKEAIEARAKVAWERERKERETKLKKQLERKAEKEALKESMANTK